MATSVVLSVRQYRCEGPLPPFHLQNIGLRISQYLINKALDGACHLPVSLLPGTVMLQAENPASPVQVSNSLAAQPGGSADPAAGQAASLAAGVTPQTVAVTRLRSHAAVRQQAPGSPRTRQAGKQRAAGSQPMRGPSILPVGPTHTNSVHSLHAQGQEAHEAVRARQGQASAVPAEGGPAEAALLHQLAEVAAAVLPSQQQPELRQPLGAGASADQPYSRQQQVCLHVASQCAEH